MSRLYFLHIPKTAGQTLSYSVLNQYFSEAEIFPAVHYSGFFGSDFRRLADYRLFRGHFYHFFVRMLPQTPAIITFLRDPVERTISSYEYMRRETGHYLHADAMGYSSLSEWLQHSRFFYPNSMVTALAADLDPFSFVTRVRARLGPNADLDAAIVSHMYSRPPGRPELERAKERLASYEFVGLTERFGESVELLRHTFAWPASERHQDYNLAAGRVKLAELSPKTQELLRQTHELDWELYRFGEELFESRLREIENRRFPQLVARDLPPRS